MSALSPLGSLQHGSPTLPNLANDKDLSQISQRTRPSKMAPNIDRSRVDPAVLEAADGMEAMFLDYMLKVMRQTVPKGDAESDSPATEIYRGMLDSEIAQKAARTGGVGLSEQIIAYLQSRSYTGNQGTGSAMNSQSAANRYQAQQAQDKSAQDRMSPEDRPLKTDI
jgi:Rod binding domain-containing protein